MTSVIPSWINTDRISSGVLHAIEYSYRKHGCHMPWVADVPSEGHYEDCMPRFVRPDEHKYEYCVGVYRREKEYDGSDEVLLIDSGVKWFCHTPGSNYHDDDYDVMAPAENDNSMYLLYWIDDADVALQFKLMQKTATKMVEPAFATRHLLHDEESEREYIRHNEEMAKKWAEIESRW